MDGGRVATYTKGDTPADLPIVTDLYTSVDP